MTKLPATVADRATQLNFEAINANIGGLTSLVSDVATLQAAVFALQGQMTTTLANVTALQTALTERYGEFVRSANQSIANIILTGIAWDTQSLNITGFGWNAGVNPSRVSVPASGNYLCVGTVIWQAASVLSNAQFYVNGGATPNAAFDQRDDANGSAVTLAETLRLTTSDYVEVMVAQASGGAINVKGNFHIVRLSA